MNERTFLTPREMGEATRGQWRVPPEPDLRLAGVGTDTRDDLRGRAFVALRGERFDGHAYLRQAMAAGAALLVVEPGAAIPDGVPALEVRETRAALADLARAWRERLRARVIGITGSAGKTTTRRLAEAVLARSLRGTASPKSFNNEIGVPLTVLAADEDDDFLILEIGTNHPGEIPALSEVARPHVGVVTNVGHAHLAGFGTVAAIAREKASLLRAVDADGVAIVHAESVALAEELRLRPPRARIVRFGVGRDADIRLAQRTPERDGGQRLELADGFVVRLRLPGEHNAINALAAIAVGRALGVDAGAIADGLSGVVPADMRLERLELEGVTLFNDAYNANPDAMVASVGTFLELARGAARCVLILGDMLELGESAPELHREVGRAIAARLSREAPAARVILVGPLARHLGEGLESDWGGSVESHPPLDDASARAIAAELESGDAVLLKGSRGMALERIVAAMRSRAPTEIANRS